MAPRGEVLTRSAHVVMAPRVSQAHKASAWPLSPSSRPSLRDCTSPSTVNACAAAMIESQVQVHPGRSRKPDFPLDSGGLVTNKIHPWFYMIPGEGSEKSLIHSLKKSCRGRCSGHPYLEYEHVFRGASPPRWLASTEGSGTPVGQEGCRVLGTIPSWHPGSDSPQ